MCVCARACVRVCRAGFRTGEAGQLTRVLHMSRHLFLFCWYSRVGWVSTAPLLKAAQGPPRLFRARVCACARVGLSSVCVCARACI